ncbi:MAG: Curli production assembly/transport component CsgG [Candidatus Magnetoglobus multicellularis str. Araruama]|uniref:Curli production assembly/transport component CsgG n=1 Tax=Candidatus Magnetoglobus multicellularis str. Araruama TaxID=890399 RepID=A0A1V1PEQ4_9BACT|nr:MAG: Curli production assembly/transport component CsgG [Candidatus Magnetoglobus multicellularis str. Araruama]
MNSKKTIQNRTMKTILAVAFMVIFIGCATESHQTVETGSVKTFKTRYSGPKSTLAIGKFANRSTYMNGIFSDSTDRLGSQARLILKTHLTQTNRFITVDRSNLANLSQESKYSGKTQKILGASLVVTGEITEFGRKVVGDHQLFGILGHGKKQIAYTKVSINIVDVQTSQIVYAVQGAGEYALSHREVIGFGGTASYDATLTDKVLNLSIMDAVNKLVEGLERGEWTSVN